MTFHVLTPAEFDRETWASCGPTALAALLHRPLAEIRHAFPHQREGRTWTNFQHMQAALRTLEIHVASAWSAPSLSMPAPWPTRGLVIVQFNGSWDVMPVNHPAQLQRTHWIAVSPLLDVGGKPVEPAVPMVFDVNLVDGFDDRTMLISCGWTTRQAWETVVAPLLAKDHGKKATGQRWIRAAIEIPNEIPLSGGPS
jgi:hypothetical protein